MTRMSHTVMAGNMTYVSFLGWEVTVYVKGF